MIAAGLPLQAAVGFVQRNQRRASSAGHDDQPSAVDERRFRKSPSRDRAAVFLRDVLRPDGLAGREIEANQDAVAGHRVETVAVDGWRAARAVAAVVAIIAAGFRFPEFLARLRVEREDELFAVALALCVDLSVDDRQRRIAFAEPVRSPDDARSAGGPGREQSGF